MKKNVAKILIMMLIVSTLVGCGKKNDTSETTEATTVETTTETVSEETSEVTTEVEATTTEATSTEATKSETEDKTETGTVSDKKTDSANSDDEYWNEYPLSMNGKSVYIKKFEELSFNKDLTVYREGKEITNEENYKTNGVILFESDNCSIMFYVDNNSFLNDMKEVFPNSADIENTTGQASVIYDNNNALYYYTVDNETYLYCFVTPLQGSFNPDSFNKYFDYVIK